MSANGGLCHSATGEVGRGRRCQNTAVEKLLFLRQSTVSDGEESWTDIIPFLLRLEALGKAFISSEFISSDSHSHTPETQYSWELERKESDPLFFPKPAWITSQEENIRSAGNRVLSFPLNPFFSSLSWQSSTELIEGAQDSLKHQGDPSVTIWVSCSPALLPRNLKAESYHTPKSLVNFTE